MKTKLLRVGTLLFTILTMSSCDLSYFEGEIEGITWNGSIASPIGYVEYSVSELLEDISSEDLSIGENDDDVITFVFNSEFESDSSTESIMEIESQNLSLDFELEGDSDPVTEKETQIYDFKKELYLSQISEYNEELTSAYFSEGEIRVKIATNIQSYSSIELEIPTFKKTSDESALTFSASFDEGGDSVNEAVYELSEYYADFTQTKSGAISFNTILLDIYIELVKEIGDQLEDGSYFRFEVTMSNMTTTLVYGDFKTRPITIDNQDLSFDAFDSFGEGELTFAAPIVRMKFDNSFGLPLGVDLGGIAAVSSSDKIRLEGEITDELQLIGSPGAGEEGNTVQTVVEINNENSNIAELISSKPTAFELDLNVYTNPFEIDGKNENFLNSSSEISGSVEVEIPMAVRFNDIPVEQVIDFDLGTDTGVVDELNINIKSTNTMPLGGSIELEFLDSREKVIFTTERIDVFTPAPVNEAGKSNGVSEDEAVLELTKGEIIQMGTASSIRVIAYLNTSNTENNQVVLLLNSDSLRLDLSGIIKLNP